jgi:ubiquitin-activating enzyme E1
VLCTEILSNIGEIKAFNAFCRQKGIGFILTQNLGAFAYAFLDYGDNFSVLDPDGEEPKAFMVTSITKSEGFATVVVHEDKRHSF